MPEESGARDGLQTTQDIPEQGSDAPKVESSMESDAQKVTRLFAQVEEVNDKLGGYVGGKFSHEDGNLIIFSQGKLEQDFSSVFPISDPENPPTRYVYFGVDNKRGPVSLVVFNTEKRFQALEDTLQGKATPNSERELEGLIWSCNSISQDRGAVDKWQSSFEVSKNAVLQNPELMGRLKVERSAILDRMVNVTAQPLEVSKPIVPTATSGV